MFLSSILKAFAKFTFSSLMPQNPVEIAVTCSFLMQVLVHSRAAMSSLPQITCLHRIALPAPGHRLSAGLARRHWWEHREPPQWLAAWQLSCSMSPARQLPPGTHFLLDHPASRSGSTSTSHACLLLPITCACSMAFWWFLSSCCIKLLLLEIPKRVSVLWVRHWPTVPSYQSPA